ncbi:sufurtransferase FdhD [Oceanicoccus sagamiensis]|uniref:Sulfur carrier protein FdhD n=1 Tax=Oceanicoccus sagamiensis TaxID=716816 RepID=A0A1X9NRU2_9GAMM|nr:sufurtransferase FdhD [Oceanicoccus sagamiensis]
MDQWFGNTLSQSRDAVAEEVAVALVYNGVSHAVMMASPSDLSAFAKGFSLTEGVVDKLDEIYGIEVNHRDDGIELAIEVSSQRFMALKHKRRHLAGRTGCGICGAESLQQLQSAFAVNTACFTIEHQVIDDASVALEQHQPLQALTGAVHGAVWCDSQGEVIGACEDVGRHNALDKLIGSLYQTTVFQQPGFLVISSRASYEIIQKAAKAGIAMVVAVSAPTSLAITMAEQAGITLIGFSREGRHVVYSHKQRVN